MSELLPCAPGSPEWLAARRAGVTATDIVTILGLSSWSSPYSLFWQKMGQVPETPDSDRFRLGRELEPYVVKRWMEDSERAAYPGGLYRHHERPWQLATLDRMTRGDNLPVEVKTWDDRDRHSWQDAPPPAVRAQVLWQMDVMDVATGHVGVVFLPSGEFRSYTIRHEVDEFRATGIQCISEDECSACFDQVLMRRAGEEFMGRLRLELPPPDPDSSAATLAAVRARFTRQPDKTAEVDKATWRHYRTYKDDIDDFTEKARGYESQLREQAGEASVLTVDGQPVARRIIGEALVKAHVRRSDYLQRIKTEADSE